MNERNKGAESSAKIVLAHLQQPVPKKAALRRHRDIFKLLYNDEMFTSEPPLARYAVHDKIDR